MPKYSYEFKLKVVKEYLSGKGGYGYLSKKYSIGNGDKKQVYKWVCAYKEFGEEGLMRSRQNQKFSFEYKLSVVKLYLTNEVSYQELALRVGIKNPTLITKWVNDFRIVGPDALKEKSKGRKATMPNPKNTENQDKNAEYLKQLENENLKLRIENAYLKELRRLRLEEEALNKKRELSATSEDYLT